MEVDIGKGVPWGHGSRPRPIRHCGPIKHINAEFMNAYSMSSTWKVSPWPRRDSHRKTVLRCENQIDSREVKLTAFRLAALRQTHHRRKRTKISNVWSGLCKFLAAHAIWHAYCITMNRAKGGKSRFDGADVYDRLATSTTLQRVTHVSQIILDHGRRGYWFSREPKRQRSILRLRQFARLSPPGLEPQRISPAAVPFESASVPAVVFSAQPAVPGPEP